MTYTVSNRSCDYHVTQRTPFLHHVTDTPQTLACKTDWKTSICMHLIPYSLCSLSLSFKVKVRWVAPGICTYTHSSAESHDSLAMSHDSPPTEPSPAVVSAFVFMGVPSCGCEACGGGGGETDVGDVGVWDVSCGGCGCVKSWQGVCPNSLTCSSMAASSLGSWTLQWESILHSTIRLQP